MSEKLTPVDYHLLTNTLKRKRIPYFQPAKCSEFWDNRFFIICMLDDKSHFLPVFCFSRFHMTVNRFLGSTTACTNLTLYLGVQHRLVPQYLPAGSRSHFTTVFDFIVWSIKIVKINSLLWDYRKGLYKCQGCKPKNCKDLHIKVFNGFNGVESQKHCYF